MVRRQRHLRGADEVGVLPLDPVDVVGRLAEEAGALHRPRLDQRRRDHRGEPGRAGLVHRHVDQRELEVGADAGQVVEPRARDLRAALDVDRAEDPAELDVVARLEPLGREVARACRARRARRSRPRRRPAPPRPRGWGSRRSRRASPARPRPGSPRPPSRRPRASWSGPAARPSPRPGPSGSACRAASARRAAARSRRSRRGGRRPPRAPGRPRRRTGRASPGQHGSGRGSSRSSRGSITSPRISSGAATAFTPRGEARAGTPAATGATAVLGLP